MNPKHNDTRTYYLFVEFYTPECEVQFYQTTRRHISEDINNSVHSGLSQNLKSNILAFFLKYS
jgi:hypothetical protein